MCECAYERFFFVCVFLGRLISNDESVKIKANEMKSSFINKLLFVSISGLCCDNDLFVCFDKITESNTAIGSDDLNVRLSCLWLFLRFHRTVLVYFSPYQSTFRVMP